MTRKRKIEEQIEEESPPEGCHHYQSRQEVPWDIQKYFDQRYSVFSRYDEGIWMTDDSWFGVTPEPIADKIAEHLAQVAPTTKTILIDVFGGAGGNSIAFARSGRWKEVHVIERDAITLACARHNAKVYGVDDVITWYHGDCFEILKDHFTKAAETAVVFASPPWGGPGYRTDQVFDLSLMQPYNLMDLLLPLQTVTKEVVLYLPRTSDLRQFVRFERKGKKLPVIHYCMEGASKALCVYFGDLCVNTLEEDAVNAPTR
ncbi:MAG: hypothetical protein GOMPHAMPRED_000651 [Gomphillus americanus]|uniref:Trimethylguanosine synthase n=1 Tax=Gomphillus americanus TaxID=1940652 RepID=A0A8H3EX68_9LECA|nr:MAG: hypothetical protein GOMPHAMPRED_000651 [Gomphillus americanus]